MCTPALVSRSYSPRAAHIVSGMSVWPGTTTRTSTPRPGHGVVPFGAVLLLNAHAAGVRGLPVDDVHLLVVDVVEHLRLAKGVDLVVANDLNAGLLPLLEHVFGRAAVKQISRARRVDEHPHLDARARLVHQDFSHLRAEGL